MKVWTACINHKHGNNFYVAKTSDRLILEVKKYVNEWWDTEITSEEMPDDVDEAIERYFELVPEESFSMDETDILE